ncbi:MAG TPA: endo alpha-1,4 polygalactosaminidase [Solirubrobacterales bacterium]|nr:endo alpha-1,4 polygalactosaminidase [Solirubrobacterales bacterium]
MKRPTPPGVLGVLLVACAALLVLAPAAGAVGGFPTKGHWRPAPQTAAWQWQLQGKFQLTPGASVYDIDGFESTRGDVRAIHRHRDKAICYLDVGSWEEYRPDAGEFPGSALGRRYEGYPEERWLDIAHFGKFAAIMERRIEMCAHKRFDAVEPDNIAGWENKTGFPLTRADQLRYDRWIAAQVHRRGMAVALKNDPRQARQLVGDFDFAIIEECFQYDECGFYKPFIVAGKAVFEAEYELPTAEFCAKAEVLDFAAIRKNVELSSRPWEPCDPLPEGTG